MNQIVETDADGVLHLSPKQLGRGQPHARYVVDVQDETVILTPARSQRPFWTTASPRERAEDFRRWAMSHADGPGLPDDALRREQLYD